jgi:hypothetical protein
MDLEKGLGNDPNNSDAQQRHMSTTTSNINGETQHHKGELEVFQTLVGIHFLVPGGGPNPDTSKQVRPANPLVDIFLPSRTAANRFRNRGLYDRVLSQDMKNRSMYTIGLCPEYNPDQRQRDVI